MVISGITQAEERKKLYIYVPMSDGAVDGCRGAAGCCHGESANVRWAIDQRAEEARGGSWKPHSRYNPVHEVGGMKLRLVESLGSFSDCHTREATKGD